MEGEGTSVLRDENPCHGINYNWKERGVTLHFAAFSLEEEVMAKY